MNDWKRFHDGYEHPQNSYRSLITSLHGPEAWDKYVWAYSLKRLK